MNNEWKINNHSNYEFISIGHSKHYCNFKIKYSDNVVLNLKDYFFSWAKFEKCFSCNKPFPKTLRIISNI